MQKFIIATLFVLAFFFICGATAFAANKTFTGPGNFSDATKWGGTLPVAGDNLRINGACTFDNAANNLTYGSLNVGRNSSGTLNWPAGGTNTLNVTAVSSSQAGSALDMTNGGTLRIRTSWTATNQTFTPGAGTIIFASTANTTMPAAITTYNNLTINPGAGITVRLGAATIVNGDLTITAGTLNTSGNNFALTLNGNFTNSATFTANGSNIIIGGASATPNIAGFSTTGALSFVRTASTATLTGNVTAASLTMDGSGGTLNLGASLSHTINGSVMLTAGTLDGNSSALSLTGNWTGSAAFTASTGTVTFSGSGAQTITNTATTFNNLTKSGAGTGTLGAAVVVNGTLNISGGTFSASTSNFTLTLNGSFTNSGTFTANGSNIIIGGTSTAPNIAGFSTTGALSFERTASTATLTGNVTAASLTMNGNGGTLNLGASLSHTINGNVTLTAGTLDGNSSALSLTSNWTNSSTFSAGTGAVTFNGTSGQTIAGTSITTFNNLTISNTSATTSATTNLTVNATLTLTGNLAMGSNTLTMGASATTAGTGDVTGIVKRTTINPNIAYSFGSQFTTMTFRLVGTLPTEVSVKITIGSAPSWKTNAIKRYYDIIQTGGSGSIATVKLHYRDSELNGNTENNMSVWHYHASVEEVEEHGSSNLNATDNWIELSNMGIAVFSSNFGDLEWTLADEVTTHIVWDGDFSTDWTDLTNWIGGVPGVNNDVIIPALSSGHFSPTLPSSTTIKSLTIQSGGTLNGGTGTQLTIAGGEGCWVNNGTFNPGTSTVIFTNAVAVMAGETNFYNVTIDTGAEMTMSTNNIMRIAGAITNNGVWRSRFLVNTVEYNGGNQTVLNPNGGTGGYQHLILSGSGTKTMPASALTIAGNFSLSGTASATAGSALTVSGSFATGSGTTFDASSLSHSIGGDFTNNGGFTASTSTITLNGTAAQTMGGTTTTAFNNLTISNTSAAVSANANFSVGGTLNVDSNVVLSPDASVVISGSGTLQGNGTVKVTRTETTPDFNSQFTISNKTLTDLTVEYTGIATQEVSSLTYGNLKINNSSGATLSGATNVNGTLTVASGILTTGSSNTLTLGSLGTLSESNDADGNLTNDSVVVGNIQTTRTLSTGVNETFGGLGIQINAAGLAPGSTIVLRKTGTGTAQTIDGIVGIKRTFEITPTTNTGLNALLVSKYADSELNGINEANLIYAKSTDGGTTWPNRHIPTRDADANTLTLTGVNELSKWTAGPFASKYIVSSSNNSPVAGSNVTITAQLADANNNAVSVAGKVVTWSSTNGGSFASATSITNASGIATVVFTTSATAGTVHTVTGTDTDNVTGTSSDITTTIAAPDTTPPTVSSTSPANGATGVAINTAISATFSETMDASTITTATFTVSDGSGNIGGTVSYSGTTATFTPSSNLSNSTAYTAMITTGVEDEAGNAMASDYHWSFTTASGPDTTPPTISSTSPMNGATGVSVSTTITATFSEEMDASAITTATFSVGCGCVDVSGTVSYNSGQKTATFTPSGNLSNSTAYSAMITTGVKDVAGNAMSSDYHWSFTTASGPDTTPPTVSSASPLNGATGVAVSTTITATFSEEMDASTITTATFTVGSGGGNVSGTVSYNSGQKTATFTPSGNLSNSTAYSAMITTGVKDVAGNAMASAYPWGFTTVSAPVFIEPPSAEKFMIISTSPLNGDIDVSINTTVSATFSMYINGYTFTTGTFKLSDGDNEVYGSVTTNGVTATFTPSENLAYNTKYSATITTGAQAANWARTTLDSNYTWSFTTIMDTEPPAVISISPAIGATDVSLDSVISVTFSEEMDASTITTDTFDVSVGSNKIDGTISYNGMTATLTPSNNLLSSTTYTVEITTDVKDLAGNAMASHYHSSFTTISGPDITPPTVVSTSPANGATGVLLDSIISVTFSEEMDASTITTDTFDVSVGSNEIDGTISYNSMTATLTPSNNLLSSTTYTVEITTDVKDLAGNALASHYHSSFTTVSLPITPMPTPTQEPTPTLTPIATTTPTPTATPTPGVCEPVRIKLKPRSLRLNQEEVDEVTVTVTGKGGCPAEDETVTATIDKAGQKRISISPTSAVTGESGEAEFTITATAKTGRAKVAFSVGRLKKFLIVSVRKPGVCKPVRIKLKPTSLRLNREEMDEVTVTVTGNGGCPVEDETITATIDKAGKKRISISPASAVTDESGEAEFTITATEKLGTAKVTFKAGKKSLPYTVKVRNK